MSEEPSVIARFSTLEDRRPIRAEVERVPLVVVRLGDEVHVLHRLCPHRGADLSCGTIEGTEIVCAEHGWGFECASGQSEGVPGADIRRFRVWVDAGRDEVTVDAVEVRAFREDEVDAFAYDL